MTTIDAVRLSENLDILREFLFQGQRTIKDAQDAFHRVAIECGKLGDRVSELEGEIKQRDDDAYHEAIERDLAT